MNGDENPWNVGLAIKGETASLARATDGHHLEDLVIGCAVDAPPDEVRV